MSEDKKTDKDRRYCIGIKKEDREGQQYLPGELIVQQDDCSGRNGVYVLSRSGIDAADVPVAAFRLAVQYFDSVFLSKSDLPNTHRLVDRELPRELSRRLKEKIARIPYFSNEFQTYFAVVATEDDERSRLFVVRGAVALTSEDHKFIGYKNVAAADLPYKVQKLSKKLAKRGASTVDLCHRDVLRCGVDSGLWHSVMARVSLLKNAAGKPLVYMPFSSTRVKKELEEICR